MTDPWIFDPKIRKSLEWVNSAAPLQYAGYKSGLDYSSSKGRTHFSSVFSSLLLAINGSMPMLYVPSHF